MPDYQLTFPFQGDEADEIARALVAAVVNVIDARADSNFRWADPARAHLEICKVREAIARDLRVRLRIRLQDE